MQLLSRRQMFAALEHYSCPTRTAPTTTRSLTEPPDVCVDLCVSARPSPTEAKCGRCEGCPSSMPSRQERRKAERDAAKRTPAEAGAAGARGGAAARTNVIPLGDWTTQAGA
jgi:hypothetical protein